MRLVKYKGICSNSDIRYSEIKEKNRCWWKTKFCYSKNIRQIIFVKGSLRCSCGTYKCDLLGKEEKKRKYKSQEDIVLK